MPIGTMSRYQPLAAVAGMSSRTGGSPARIGTGSRAMAEREAMRDAFALQRDRHAEEHRGQLDHHEDAEQAERRSLAEIDELRRCGRGAGR